MKKYIPVFVCGLVLGFAVGIDAPMADAAPKVEASKDLPRSGDLAAALTGGYGSRELAEPWGGVDERGEQASPITGSISKRNAREWSMRVFNNSDDPYTVQLQVNMYGRTGGKTKSDTFSYSLKPKGTAERTVVAPIGTEDAQLSLLSWRKLVSKEPSGTKPPEKGATPVSGAK